jgi:hypothetical protein
MYNPLYLKANFPSRLYTSLYFKTKQPHLPHTGFVKKSRWCEKSTQCAHSLICRNSASCNLCDWTRSEKVNQPKQQRLEIGCDKYSGKKEDAKGKITSGMAAPSNGSDPVAAGGVCERVHFICVCSF